MGAIISSFRKPSGLLRMKIIVDAMGGDYAPQEIVKGAVEAARAYKVDIVLVGKQEAISPFLRL